MTTLNWRRQHAGGYISTPASPESRDSWFSIAQGVDDNWNVFQVHPRYNSKDELLSVHTTLVTRTATLKAGKAAAQRKRDSADTVVAHLAAVLDASIA